MQSCRVGESLVSRFGNRTSFPCQKTGTYTIRPTEQCNYKMHFKIIHQIEFTVSIKRIEIQNLMSLSLKCVKRVSGKYAC